MRLSGKVAVITGAGSGIGRACAELFAREGASVVIAERDQDAGTAAMEAVRQAGGQAIFVPTDVSDEASMQAMVDAALASFGKIDILYNNVGGSTQNDNDVVRVSNDEFWLKIRVDLFGTWLGCRLVIPHMIANGGGSIVNATSIAALIGTRGRDAYTCAKGAISALTQSLAVEFAPQKIRVNAVAPAGTMTERVASRFRDGKRTGLAADTHLLGFSEPIEVAYAVLYLASEEARTTTGTILKVDSGVSIS